MMEELVEVGTFSPCLSRAMKKSSIAMLPPFSTPCFQVSIMLKALKRAKGAKDVTGQCWRYVVEVVIN